MNKPDLSIIVPTLNEANSLPLLLADLVGQKGIDFEVIVSDGESADSTVEFAKDFFSAKELSGRCLVGSPGKFFG